MQVHLPTGLKTAKLYLISIHSRSGAVSVSLLAFLLGAAPHCYPKASATQRTAIMYGILSLYVSITGKTILLITV